ncbi:hypothetical protein STVIR_8187 [Streptomyces viridochromogenes Tue57]|uniref:Uncharacterized protein n=1 Tax=Streptomyces viridochromogenes Tue57 TaxID=1160705 RepID=L8P3W5_STRVR|nr:hypothetical protein STVIR_8187 [Streptomyces viridochromogenes Tue57]
MRGVPAGLPLSAVGEDVAGGLVVVMRSSCGSR